MSSSLLKKLAIAAGVLVVLWVVYIYRQVPHSQTLFAKTEDQAKRLLLQRGAKTVELQKQGNTWKVSSSSTSFYAADESQVKSLLSALKNVQLEDEISDRLDRAAEYEVTLDSGTHIQVFGAQESKLGEGIFGKQAPDYAHIYFRYMDKPIVYLARGLIRGELGGADVNSWRSRQLMDIPETKIQSITIESNGEKTELVRASTDVWNLNGKATDPAPVNTLVGILSHLRAEDFVDPMAYPQLTYDGLKEANIRVKGSGSSIELRVGAEDSKLKRFPISVGKEAGLAWLSEASVKSILQNPSFFKEKK